MKKILFALLLCAQAFLSNAQQYRYGIKAGINLSQLGMVTDVPNPELKTFTGFHAGGILDIEFKNFSIQPGLFFSAKGNEIKSSTTGAIMTSNIVTKLNYIELPVNFLYSFRVGRDTKIFAGGGPYAAYTLSGGWYANGRKISTATFGNHDDYKRIDYGLNFVGGIEVNDKLQFSTGYGFGGKVNNKMDNLKNKVLSFSVGYLF